MPCAAGCVRTPAARELRKQPCCDGRCGSARRRRGLRGQAGVRASAGPPPDARNLCVSDIIWRDIEKKRRGLGLGQIKRAAGRRDVQQAWAVAALPCGAPTGTGSRIASPTTLFPTSAMGGFRGINQAPLAAPARRSALSLEARQVRRRGRALAALRCDALCDAALPQAHARGLSLTPAGACAALAGPLSYACLRLGASVGSAFAFAFAGGGDGGV